MAEWTPILQLRWYSWIPIDLYESLIGVVMALFALAVGVIGFSSLLGIIPKETVHALSWYWMLLAIILAGALAWVALSATWTSTVDLLCPALAYQGRLERIKREHVRGQLGGYYVWTLESGEKKWSIPCTDVPDTFRQEVTIGRLFRLTYRQGTGLVTHLWVAPGED